MRTGTTTRGRRVPSWGKLLFDNIFRPLFSLFLLSISLMSFSFSLLAFLFFASLDFGLPGSCCLSAFLAAPPPPHCNPGVLSQIPHLGRRRHAAAQEKGVVGIRHRWWEEVTPAARCLHFDGSVADTAAPLCRLSHQSGRPRRRAPRPLPSLQPSNAPERNDGGGGGIHPAGDGGVRIPVVAASGPRAERGGIEERGAHHSRRAALLQEPPVRAWP